MSSYREFDLKAKELGYWQVTTFIDRRTIADTYLCADAKSASELASHFARGEYGYTVQLLSPDDWQARA